MVSNISIITLIALHLHKVLIPKIRVTGGKFNSLIILSRLTYNMIFMILFVKYKRWYKLAKQTQKPGFSDIYSYAATDMIGITYFHPIYEANESKKVFYGVLAANLALDDISSMLQNITKNNIYTYGICEDRPPHRMVGISTGKQLTYQSCSVSKSEGRKCKSMLLNINEIGNNGKIENMMLQKAHASLYGDQFPPNRTVAIDGVDEQGNSHIYVASSQFYHKPGNNIKWRVITIWPMTKTLSATAYGTNGIFILALSVIGFAICLSLLVHFYQERKERAVQLADFQLTSAFLVSCALVNLSFLLHLGQNTTVTCNLKLWIPRILIFTTLSIIIVKMYRLYVLVTYPSNSAARVRLNNRKIWLYLLPIPMIDIFLTAISSLLGPMVAKTEVSDDLPPRQIIVCHMNYKKEYLAIEYAYYFLVICAGCYLAYLIRHLDNKMNDVRENLFTMYNYTFMAVVFFTIKIGANLSSEDYDIIFSVCTFMSTVFSSAAFVVPRLIAAERDRKAWKLEVQRQIATSVQDNSNMRRYPCDENKDSIHSSDNTFRILICSSNMGNAAPTLSSMKAWIPEGGCCDKVKPLEKEQVIGNNFHLIVIGMQEATWSTEEDENRENNDFEGNEEENQFDSNMDVDAFALRSSMTKDEIKYLTAIAGEDTMALRKMVTAVLGIDYLLIAKKKRGQMRMHIYALKKVAPLIDNIKFSGTNTGLKTPQ